MRSQVVTAFKEFNRNNSERELSKLNRLNMEIIQSIQNRIYEIRGERVILDFDLAEMYEVETRVLNQAIKRNLKRFPNDFMFQLNVLEWNRMMSQFVISSQIRRKTTSPPYAFTEQGVAMLSGVLHSNRAITMNIAIMRAFVDVRKILLSQDDLREQMRLIKERIGEHDAQLNQIYEAMENLLDVKAAERKWNNRTRIGFINK